jgi:alpha-galactosidase
MLTLFRHVGWVLLPSMLIVASPARGANTVSALGDAYIAQDSATGTWTLGAGGATLALRINSTSDYQVTRLLSGSGHNWTAQAQPDTVMVVNGSTLSFGSRASGFQYQAVSTSNDGHVLRLDATFTLLPMSLLVTRHVAITDGTPTFEVWTTFQSVGGQPVSISNINAFQSVIPAGTLHWLTGHQAAAGDSSRDSAFMQQQQTLAVGQSLTLGATNRSSEQTVPWLAVDGAQDEFYAGLMWSGNWSLTVNGVSAGLSLSWGFAAMTTSVGATAVDGPHALFGVAPGTLPDASAAMGSYVLKGIRAGRPLTPLVTYNTWFAYGTDVREDTMMYEIRHAAAVGAELFVMDAGWYLGADTVNTGDFDQGLGSWVADPARFPDGLPYLVAYAHSLGIKFGIWVEPERVNLSFVGAGGVDESWLATQDGSYLDSDSALICLGNAAGRQWVVNQLTTFIDAVQPDYLKWDNNLWVNCNRAGHNHGTTDGSFAHNAALYQILDTLRQTYPNLEIENCAQGGNRLDFGMLRYTDAAWMDDDTSPSAHVRHNLEGLGPIFPPAYLLSFVTNDIADGEPVDDAPDLPLYFRSRMGGVLGLCWMSTQLTDADDVNISQQITLYQTLRTSLTGASAAVLTQPASLTAPPAWDVLQATAPGGNLLVVYAYQNDQGTETVTVIPADLQPDTTYDVYSVDTGLLGTATGEDIVANGIEVDASPTSAAHILTLTARLLMPLQRRAPQ